MPITCSIEGDNWPVNKDFVNMLCLQICEHINSLWEVRDTRVSVIFSNRNYTTPLGNNAYQIEVIFKADHWSEFVVGFGHELCHTLSNIENLNSNASAWVNEAICHTLAVYCLHRTAKLNDAWEKNKTSYFQNEANEIYRKNAYLADSAFIATYFKERQRVLEETNYAIDPSRSAQWKIGQYWVSHFLEQPSDWSILASMNPSSPPPVATGAYFNEWYQSEHNKRHAILKLADMIGITIQT